MSCCNRRFIIRQMRIGKSVEQLICYGLIGAISNLVIYGAYFFITNSGIEPKMAMTFVYVFGVVIGFLGNRKWTFNHSEDTAKTVIRFAVAHLLGYLLNFLMLIVFVDQLGYSHQWVQAVAIVIVACFLFIIFKYLVFTKKNGRK